MTRAASEKNERWRAPAPSRTLLERTLAFLIVSALLGVIVVRYERVMTEARQSALRVQLQAIRQVIVLYGMVHSGGSPADLRELAQGRYTLQVGDRVLASNPYLYRQATDPEGYPVDPFGNRYQYDPATGRVASSTLGYDKW